MNLVRRVLLALSLFSGLAGLPRAAGQPYDPALYAEMRWRLIGPYRGGRTVAGTGVPGRPHLFYVGVNNGGVWKTTDAGRTWEPIFDGQPTGSIGALAVAPSNPEILYVGSGEGLQRPDLSVGDGIYKSLDGGKSWRHLGLRDGRQIGAILVDPKDSNRLFVAVLGHPYGPNVQRGVFRSTDGGASFEKVLYKDENTGAIDLAFDPADSRTVYAVLWAARLGPWEYENEYSGPGSGLFRSTDGGTSWQQIGEGLPTPAEGLGRIGIGIAPGDPNRIYALVQAAGKRQGLYRSEDAGRTFARVNGEDRVTGRGEDFACVRVDPRNRDVVYVGNTSTYRSTDGGVSFTAFKGAPGGDDYHGIWLDPDRPEVILLTADQGATVSVNGGKTWSSWYNQPTGQMFHVTADNRFPYWVYGGQQESGSAGVASRGNDGQITARDWHTVGVEEYGYAAPDPLNPGVVYGGKVTRYDEKTGMTQQIGPVVLRTGKYRFVRTAPILFSPVDPHVLYFGLNVLFKTSDGGQHWETISPDLGREDAGVPANLGIYAEKARRHRRGVIYSIGPSPKDAGTIWAGTDDGLIHVTRDGGKSWKNVTPPEMTPWSKVTQIDASHFDAETAYASVSRFRLDDLSPCIYRTRDGGRSWQRIVRGLPDDAPVNVVREDPERRGLLFAGTERAVWVSFDDGEHWQPLQQNLPATSMRDLVVKGDDLVVATHGRSFWILDDVTPLRQLTPAVAASAGHLFRPERTWRVRRDQNTDTPLPPEEPAGKNPPDGAILDYWLGTAPAGPVTLEIADAAGKLVRRFSSAEPPEPADPGAHPVPAFWFRPPQPLSAAPGMHRFVWDLHYPPPAVLRREFPISAIAGDTPLSPQGPVVPPGRYTVTLTVSGAALSQPLTVEMDPRVETPPEGLKKQFDLAMAICEELRKDDEALRQVRRMRGELASRRERVKDGSLLRDLVGLDARAAELENGGGSEGSLETQGLSRLNARFGTLLEVVEGADASPTSQAVEAFGQARAALGEKLQRWQELRGRDAEAVNEKLRAANLPPLPL
ncbi:MAG: glycoside hydrolase [Acidobacteriota bacterium]